MFQYTSVLFGSNAYFHSELFHFLQRFENQPGSDRENRRRSCPEVSDPRRRRSELSPAVRQSTVLVTGLTTDLSEDDLTDYFENVRRSKGGPVSKVDINRERQTCFVTFESPDGKH